MAFHSPSKCKAAQILVFVRLDSLGVARKIHTGFRDDQGQTVAQPVLRDCEKNALLFDFREAS